MIKILVGQWLGTGYVAIASLLITFVIGRSLGVSNFSDYSYIINIAYIYFMVIEGGYKSLIFREEIRRSENELKFDIKQLSKLSFGHIFIATIVGWIMILILPTIQKAALASAFLFMA